MKESDMYLKICKAKVEKKTGMTFNNFYINRIQKSRGYISKRPIITCYVSYDNHPQSDQIFSEVLHLDQSEIRDVILNEILD